MKKSSFALHSLVCLLALVLSLMPGQSYAGIFDRSSGDGEPQYWSRNITIIAKNSNNATDVDEESEEIAGAGEVSEDDDKEDEKVEIAEGSQVQRSSKNWYMNGQVSTVKDSRG